MSRTPAPRVSIVVPAYNNAHLTRACLDSIFATTDPALYELIVVDNASHDETPALLAAEEAAGRLRAVTVPENIGFAGACNLGASHATAPLVLFLNNDTVALPGWLDALLAAARSPEVGVVGAKLLYPDGTIQHAGIELINGVPDHPHRGAPADLPQANEARELDMVTGACLLIRRDLFAEVGGFDRSYRMGVEDVELCLQARDAGFKVVYEPAAVLEHHEAQSPDRFNHVRENLQLFFSRWSARFDADGRLVIRKSRIWRGDAGSGHSLAVVNDGLIAALRRAGETVHQVARSSVPLDHPGIGIAGHWPPDWQAPSNGPYVLYQPWEFGEIPAAWAEEIRRSVDEVWTPSEYARQSYLEAGIAPELVHVVPNGVDLERFAPDGRAWPLPERPATVFLFVGGTTYRKGIDVLLDAYGRAFADADEVLLVIKGFGSTTYYRGQTAEQAIAEFAARPGSPSVLALDEHLSYEEIPALYRAADCVVQPYRGEGFCLPALEALACGLPLIATAGGPTDDFASDACAWRVPSRRAALPEGALPPDLQPEGSGWLLEPDADALVDALRAATDPHARAAKAAHARVHAERFGWDAAAARARERLAVLDGRGPIRNVAPAVLADARALVLAAHVDWDRNETWVPTLSAYASAFGPDDDTTLILPAPDETLALERVTSYLSETSVDADSLADIVLADPVELTPTSLELSADAFVHSVGPRPLRARRIVPPDGSVLRSLLHR